MEFENYEWYKTGNVAVRHGSREIVGTDTDWLKAGIKSGDILVLDNQIHEIEEVTASTNREGLRNNPPRRFCVAVRDSAKPQGSIGELE